MTNKPKGKLEETEVTGKEFETTYELEIEFDEEEYLKPKKVQAIRNREYANLVYLFDKLYKESKAGNKFENLMDLILSRNNILLAFRNLKNNKGANTPGVDGMTMKDLAKIPFDELVELIRSLLKGKYEPQPVRRVYIPKPGSEETRPLGIPCALEKLIQQCIKQVLEPILEAKFYKHSYGFRPGRSTKHAIARCYALSQKHGYHFVAKVDIKGFFDNVNHTKLIKQLWNLGIQDEKLLCIINSMLKAEIIEPNGDSTHPDRGTPQGGVLSPLLANVVLNELDWWIASQWEYFPAETIIGTPYFDNGNKYKALRKKSRLKQIFIVRYADDFLIFAKTKDEAERILIATIKWLKERLKLEVSEKKTGIINLRKKCAEFLGIKFKLHKKGDKWVIISHITGKAHKQIYEKLSKLIDHIQHPTDSKNRFEWINHYNSAVMGFHEYYKMATHVSKDMNRIAYCINKKLYNRFFQFEKDPKHGNLNPESAIAKKYGKSGQLRFIEDIPIAPIGYIKHQFPLGKQPEICQYTREGRKSIHEFLKFNISVLMQLLLVPTYDRSIEFCDNRTSKFCEQYGLCAITGVKLSIFNIHCHHIIPKSRGGPNDSYSNLLLVREDVHRLIHATNINTIAKYLPIIKDEKQLAKLNKYRRLVGNKDIPNLMDKGLQLSFF